MNDILLKDQLYILSRYSPKYIDEQFKNFFAKNLITFPTLQLSCNIISNDDFQILRERLLQKRTSVQSKRLKRLTKAKMTATEREQEQQRYHAIAEQRLIVHTTYEKRLASLKSNIHKLWCETFNGTPLASIRFIVGNRHRKNSRRELLTQKLPPSLGSLRHPRGE